MDFSDFISLKELGFLIEAPVITTRAVGGNSIYIDPSTGKSWRSPQRLEQLKKIKEEYPKQKLYVHFSDGVKSDKKNLEEKPQPKLGINPLAKDGATPIGIYAYPIDYVIDRYLKSGYDKIPYGLGMMFMLVFKIKKENILLFDDEEITDENHEQMIVNLKSKVLDGWNLEKFDFPFKEEFIKIAEENKLDLTKILRELLTRDFRPARRQKAGGGVDVYKNSSAFVYKLTGLISQEIALKNQGSGTRLKKSGERDNYYVKWTSLLKRLGFTGVEDRGTETMYEAEPTQAVFFDPKQLELVGIIKNDIREKKHWETTDSPYQRWFKGILKRMESNLNLTHITNISTSANSPGLTTKDIYSIYEHIIKIIIYINSYSKFSKKIEKENPNASSQFKEALKLGIYDNGINKLDVFLTNYKKLIDGLPEMMKHIKILRDLAWKINNILLNDTNDWNRISKEFPKPSFLREMRREAVFDLHYFSI